MQCNESTLKTNKIYNIVYVELENSSEQFIVNI